jgi:hypothetical protein
MKISFGIFREFLDTKHIKFHNFLTKIANNLSRKYHTFLTKIQHMTKSQKKYQENDQEHIGKDLEFF